MVTIYHNPMCSKSREGLGVLEELGIDFDVVKYLDATVTKKELKALLKKLGMKPMDIVRQKEPVWIEQYKGGKFTNEEIINILLKHPILIERPIVVNGHKAVIGRPASNISLIL